MNNTDDNRNMIYFLIASMVLLFGYQFFVLGPQQKQKQAAAQVAAAAASSSSAANIAAGLPATAPTTLTVQQALASSPRVPIDTPSVKGSIALKGAVIDDLHLVKYLQKLGGKDTVTLLKPAGTKDAQYVRSGFNMQNVAGAPTPDTVWTVGSGSVLSVGKPVVLVHDAGNGLRFERTLSIDENYMITQADRVINRSTGPATFAPYAMVVRNTAPKRSTSGDYVHQGTMATFCKTQEDCSKGRYLTNQSKFHELVKGKDFREGSTTGGWYAITEEYWMAAVIPDQKQGVNYRTRSDTVNGTPTFTAGYAAANSITVPAGQMWNSTSHIFAGAKHDDQLKAYEKTLGIPRFKYAVDWGSLEFITYPFYLLLNWLYKAIGNMGLAILALTVIVKVAFYPLAHRSYEQMTKLRHVQQRLQPKLDAIKKKFPDDMQKQQEATMKLYQEEKVNPMAGLGGCLPMLLQIPVFICLFKVLQMSIDMRHAPFFGWIKDLSAPDPLTIINLFGLLPFDPATVPLIGGILAGPLHIGPIAILYGLSMWASQEMTPMAGIDPMQKRMMAFMPLIMIFFFSQLAIGLMIYYFWSNILTILQQYLIYKRLKVDNPLDEFIAKITGKAEKKAA